MAGPARRKRPASDPHHEVYSKRAMAADVVEVMEELGHVRFAAVGHDRGARVAYRLALDHPGRVERLAVLDIMPTLTMWESMDATRAMQVYHWTFLAQPAPMPERLIAADPIAWHDDKLASWSGTQSLKPFDPRALAHYRAFFNNPDRIHALCEDYRAGATIDLAQDQADRDAGKTHPLPHARASGAPRASRRPVRARSTPGAPRFAPADRGRSGDSPATSVAEENPGATLALLFRS